MRKAHLPDFSNPPLDEVVLGVQFAQIPDYSSINANAIWSLFKDDFPKVIEQPMLEPRFETFGGANPQPSFQFQVGPGPVGSRLWFLSSDENHLLQFQSDRFLLNWRKRPKPQAYPRFEEIARRFEESMSALEGHLETTFRHQMDVNQAEVSYMNIIPVTEFADVGKIFKFWDSGDIDVEGFNSTFNEVIHDDSGKPIARLTHEIQSVFASNDSRKFYRLSLTFRGKPDGNDIPSAMRFIELGRDKIVTRFGEITTDEAQISWGKVQ